MKLSSPYTDEDEIEEIRRALATGNISGTSPVVREFERMIEEYCDIEHAIATSSCTTALHLACLAVDIRPGDEVIVAAYSFPASGYAPLYCGATPVFCDIEEDTFNIDPRKVASLVTDKTKAIIPVDTFGNPCDIKRIVRAIGYDIPVIEDAACALGSMYYGHMCGYYSWIGCYSFYAIKNLTTGGEGGCCVTGDVELADAIRSYADFGKTYPVKTFDRIGYNYRLSGVGAAMGIAQLRKLDWMIKYKHRLVSYYKKRFFEENLYWLQPQVQLPNTQHSYQRFVCLIDPIVDRDKLIDGLRNMGVESTIGTYCLSDLPVFGEPRNCPVATDVFNRTISLPLHCYMTESDVDVVVSAIKKVVGK